MDNRIAYKVQKVKNTKSTKNLLKEMYREEKDRAKYDNGVRDLHPEKTKMSKESCKLIVLGTSTSEAGARTGESRCSI